MDLEQTKPASKVFSQSIAMTQQHIKAESDDEEIVLNNQDHCFKCKRRGEIYCCDNCFRSFHGEGDCMPAAPTEYIVLRCRTIWTCPCCLMRHKCPVCDVAVQPLENYQVCSVCCRKTHYPCTGVPKNLLKPLDEDLTFASQCYFICYVCLHGSEIHSIVKTQMTEEYGNYNLVNPYFSSTAHLGWISDANLKNITNKPKKLKHSLAMTNMPFQKAFIDRILAIKSPIIYQRHSSYEVLHMLRDPNRRVDHGDPNNFKFYIKWQDLDHQYSTWEDQYLVRQSPCNSLQCYLRRKEYQLFVLIEKTSTISDFRVPPVNSAILEPRQEKLLDEMIEMYRNGTSIVLNKWPPTQRKCQTTIVALLRHLFYNDQVTQPFLIFAKYKEFSTWYRLFEQFCPELYVVNLTGLLENRNIIKTHELFYEEAGTPKFDIMLTSYECFSKDHTMFYNNQISVKWGAIVYDDEMRCHTLFAGRPYIHETFKIILTKQYTSVQVRQILTIISPTNKPLPVNIENDNLIRLILQWIPKSFQEWPQFEPELRKKTKLYQSGVSKPQIKELPKANSLKKNRQSEEDKLYPEIGQSLYQPPTQMQMVPMVFPVVPREERASEGAQMMRQRFVSADLRAPSIPTLPLTEIVKTTHLSKGPQTQQPKWPKCKRIAFLRFILSFGMEFSSYISFAAHLAAFDKNMFETTPTAVAELRTYVKIFVSELMNPNPQICPHMMLKLEPNAIHRRITDLKNIRKAFIKYSAIPDQFPFKNRFDLIPAIEGRVRNGEDLWKQTNDLLLIKLILQYGFDNWQEICESAQWQNEVWQGRHPHEIILRKTNRFEAVLPAERQRTCERLLATRANLLFEYFRQVNVI